MWPKIALVGGIILALATVAPPLSSSQTPHPSPTPNPGDELVVTVLARHGGGTPSIAQSQVEVEQGHARDPIATWRPYAGADSRVDLALAIDDDTQNLGNRLDDIKSFVRNLPDNVAVAIVYLHTGSMTLAQPFTLNHDLAVKALHMPSGAPNVSPSPFTSLQELMQRWPRHPDHRREMVLFSDAEEHLGGNDSTNQTFQRALGQAVAGNIVVYGLFVTGASEPLAANTQANDNGGITASEYGTPLGHAGSKAQVPLSNFGSASTNSAAGTINLSLLAEATGGQAYAEGNATPARLTPYLEDVAARLKSQYKLVITPDTSGETGVVPVKISIKNAGQAQITVPKQLYVAKP